MWFKNDAITYLPTINKSWISNAVIFQRTAVGKRIDDICSGIFLSTTELSHILTFKITINTLILNLKFLSVIKLNLELRINFFYMNWIVKYKRTYLIFWFYKCFTKILFPKHDFVKKKRMCHFIRFVLYFCMRKSRSAEFKICCK